MFYIHKYAVALQYGGPEEGGWWYDEGFPVEDWDSPSFDDREYAFQICRQMNESERERREVEEEYEYHSVLAYRSQHFAYGVEEDPIPRPFPEHRPHYE